MLVRAANLLSRSFFQKVSFQIIRRKSNMMCSPHQPGGNNLMMQSIFSELLHFKRRVTVWSRPPHPSGSTSNPTSRLFQEHFAYSQTDMANGVYVHRRLFGVHVVCSRPLVIQAVCYSVPSSCIVIYLADSTVFQITRLVLF